VQKLSNLKQNWRSYSTAGFWVERCSPTDLSEIPNIPTAFHGSKYGPNSIIVALFESHDCQLSNGARIIEFGAKLAELFNCGIFDGEALPDRRIRETEYPHGVPRAQLLTELDSSDAVGKPPSSAF